MSSEKGGGGLFRRLSKIFDPDRGDPPPAYTPQAAHGNKYAPGPQSQSPNSPPACQTSPNRPPPPAQLAYPQPPSSTCPSNGQSAFQIPCYPQAPSPNYLQTPSPCYPQAPFPNYPQASSATCPPNGQPPTQASYSFGPPIPNQRPQYYSSSPTYPSTPYNQYAPAPPAYLPRPSPYPSHPPHHPHPVPLQSPYLLRPQYLPSLSPIQQMPQQQQQQHMSRGPIMQPTPNTPSAYHGPTFLGAPGAGLDPSPFSGHTLRAPSPSPSVISRESVTNDNDKYAFLSTFDTVFLIDDSASMKSRDRGHTQSRWEEAGTCLGNISPICTAHDEDGIDIYFLNHKSRLATEPDKGPHGYYNVQRPDEVHEIFTTTRPSGGTLTGKRLRSILAPYLALLERYKADLDQVKPVNIIVITDGEAQDDVESVIIEAARKLDVMEAAPYQVGIQFFQVGTDATASEALRELDDDLQARAEVRDIVDTVTFKDGETGGPRVLTSELILKTLLGSVIKRLDRK